MNICIFGAGSLGSALGGLLAGRHEVTMVARRENVLAIRRHGLRLVGDVGLRVEPVCVEKVDGLEPPRLLIVCTKAYDTQNAVDACRHFVDEDTMVLTLQNGLGNLEILRKWRKNRAFGGTTTMGAALVSPGIVRVSGLGVAVIGSDLDASGAIEIASAFESSGLPARVRRDIISEIWAKAIVNACINPMTSILRVSNGRLLSGPTISRFMREVSIECEHVTRAEEINLPQEEMYSRVQSVCRNTSNNLSSMLQDIMNGRHTEIQQINGVFCSTGRRSGIPTPLNDTLVASVSSLENFSRKEKG